MDKWQHTMDIFEDYERRFAEARLAHPRPDFGPRAFELREAALKMLGISEEQIPKISNIEELSVSEFEGYDAVTVRYETFPHAYGAAEIYRPRSEGKHPIVFLFAGHGVDGRKTLSYRQMCHRMAASGAIVISPDGMGQGDREIMGHRTVYPIFSAGITMQGLMVLESLALINHFSADPSVDSARVAACGNSGGGTMCLLLAALSRELTVLAATGYPSDFTYILSKERRHCACNLLPGCAHGPDMWEFLSAFAPRPLLIEQGENDHLIPYDYFMRTARKVSNAYRVVGAEDKFEAKMVQAGHSWTIDDINVIAEFLCRNLNLELAADFEAPLFDGAVELPSDCTTVYDIAEMLTGKKIDRELALKDIFVPKMYGKVVNSDDIVADIGRGDVMQVFAQMECALKEI